MNKSVVRREVLFCAYREWAVNVYEQIEENSVIVNSYNLKIVKTQEDLLSRFQSTDKPDIVICVGWSWKIPDSILSSSFVCGVHPSDLPAYAGGTPIQHQVLSGLEDTKMTLFRFTEKVDEGPILQKTELSLSGGIKDIFEDMQRASKILIAGFLVMFPEVHEIALERKIQLLPRLRPEESEIKKEQIQEMSCKELYNFIRCREAPYPNAFVRDDSGTLYFSGVKFDTN